MLPQLVIPKKVEVVAPGRFDGEVWIVQPPHGPPIASVTKQAAERAFDASLAAMRRPGVVVVARVEWSD